MAVEATLATRSTHELTARAVDLLRLVWEAFRRQDPAPLAAAERLLRSMRRSYTTPGAPPDQLITSVADLLGSVRAMAEESVPFTERALREINSLFDKGIELVECARDALATENRVLVRHILGSGTQYAQLASDYAITHQQRLVEGVCLPRASSVYLGMLEHLKGVGWHARQITEELALKRQIAEEVTIRRAPTIASH
jgi:hypothetical protein